MTKQPDVWVSLDDIGVEWCSVHKPTKQEQAMHMVGPCRRYTPAKPPKVCVWDQRGSLYLTGCGTEQVWHGKFCCACGGRIKVKR